MRWIVGLVAASLFALFLGCNGSNDGKGEKLLNVSYDPTRELWSDLNEAFIAKYEKESGNKIEIEQSHGGSGSQARSVIDGLEADVVTLALWIDTDAIRKKGLIADDWQDRLPNKSLPYYSTIVFVVRKGNPKNIKGWEDLQRDDVKIVTPNPKTSGNGKLSLLAAWGAAKHAKKDDDEALQFVTKLYKNVPVLDTGARGSTVTFTQREIGDVHLTWENEAHLEIAEAKGNLEIIYPSTSIKAEPFVAVVNENVKRKGTKELAEKYLQFVYTDEGQKILAKHHYRPTSKTVAEEIAKNDPKRFPKIDLVEITEIAKDWGDADAKFFGKDGIYEKVTDALKKSR